MPRRDGTGPMSKGAMTGRGLGVCSEVNTVNDLQEFGNRLRLGLGLGHRRGFGRTQNKTQEEILQRQKKLLENRISIIDKQLDNL